MCEVRMLRPAQEHKMTAQNHLLRAAGLLLLLLLCGCRSMQPYQLSEPPAHKNPFYCQHVSCGGFAVLASDKVSHFALFEAA